MPQIHRFRACTALLVLSFCTVVTTRLAASDADRSFTVRVFGAAAGPPMLFVPGLMSAGDVWQATAVRYSARYRVHLITLAGFAGTAAVPAEPFLASVRDDLLAYISREHLALAHILDRYTTQYSKVRDVTVIAATRARHFIMLDDPAFLHAEMDRFFVTRLADRRER